MLPLRHLYENQRHFSVDPTFVPDFKFKRTDTNRTQTTVLFVKGSQRDHHHVLNWIPRKGGNTKKGGVTVLQRRPFFGLWMVTFHRWNHRLSAVCVVDSIVLIPVSWRAFAWPPPRFRKPFLFFCYSVAPLDFLAFSWSRLMCKLFIDNIKWKVSIRLVLYTVVGNGNLLQKMGLLQMTVHYLRLNSTRLQSYTKNEKTVFENWKSSISASMLAPTYNTKSWLNFILFH